jgi:thioredoxin reductase (NADPH)
VTARTVVVASGARYRKPALENLERFEGRGVYYAAAFMEAQFCTGQEVIVVGGGNSAGQAAVFLAGHVRHVHVLVRSSGLAASMSNYLIQRIDATPNITLRTETEIVELIGDGALERVRWRHGADVEERPIEHVFLFLGAAPNTEWINSCLALDAAGFVKTGTDISAEELRASAWPLERPPHRLETSRPGIFAVGDVRSGSVKRVAAAVGEGSTAVQLVHLALGEAR